MKINRFLCVFALMLLANIFTFANPQQYFRKIGVGDGLSQSTVWCSLQDNQGFMWFGTKDGLNRYDGYNIKQYRDSDNLGLGDNLIRTMMLSQDNKIWIGTANGLYIYDPEFENFTSFNDCHDAKIVVSGDVNDIVQNDDGIIFFTVGWHGVYRYDPKDRSLDNYEYLNTQRQNILSTPWCLSFDSQDKDILWIGTHSYGLVKMNTRTEMFEQVNKFTGNNIHSMCDYGDSLLIGTDNGGLFTISKNSFKTKNLINYIFVRDILANSSNEIWLATESGVIVYDNNKESIISQYTHNPYDKFSISSNAVYSISKDSFGSLWIGTYFGGVNHLNNNSSRFKKFYSNSSNNFNAVVPREFFEDKNGILWLGSEDNGLYSFDPKNQTFKSYSQVSYYNIHALCVIEDHLWIGTFTDGINVMDIKSGKIIKHIESNDQSNSLSNNNVFSLCEDANGNIWIGTIYGLNIYDSKTNKISIVKGINPNIFVYDLKLDSRGVMWIASYGDGVYSYDNKDEKWIHYSNTPNDSTSLSDGKVVCIAEDYRGNMWFGTEGGGACKLDISTGKFKNYDTSNLLSNNVIYKIIEDNNKSIWLSSNYGLTAIDSTLSNSLHYTIDDGLLHNQFNYKSGIKTSDGTIYFGSLGGFISFNPTQFSRDTLAPKVILTELDVNYKPIMVNAKDSILKRSLQYTKSIELPYSSSTITLNFSSLNINSTTKNIFSYKLDGYNNDWINTTELSSITYSQLSPGTYTFEIKSSNPDGVWSKNPTKLNIEILPPWWSTYTAFTIYAILILVALCFIIRYFIVKIQEKSYSQINAVRYLNEKTIHTNNKQFQKKLMALLNIVKTQIGSLSSNSQTSLYSDLISSIEENLNLLQKSILDPFNTYTEIQSSPGYEPEEPKEISPSDKRFIEKMIILIDKNISNESFSVDMLAEGLNMSRSSLHRKVKAITKLPPNDYIRVFRLEKAALYLKQEQLSISEISHRVGFSSPSYFTKCFKTYFGVLPKEFTIRQE